ncbi:MAG: NUDIX domain-containing protein [Firmicutes bacterium]|nr:NUDIX domain-containing protein [Bacillota bacterium]
MKIYFYDTGAVEHERLKFAVICASYENRWVLVKHKQRNTWEIPGGHREPDEHINMTAKRELYEETGAKKFDMKAICDYAVTIGNETSFGRLFYSDIQAFGQLPDLEIEIVRMFDELPNALTYPEIQPHLLQKVLQFKKERA